MMNLYFCCRKIVFFGVLCRSFGGIIYRSYGNKYLQGYSGHKPSNNFVCSWQLGSGSLSDLNVYFF